MLRTKDDDQIAIQITYFGKRSWDTEKLVHLLIEYIIISLILRIFSEKKSFF